MNVFVLYAERFVTAKLHEAKKANITDEERVLHAPTDLCISETSYTQRGKSL